jgi:hypothetical protein
MNKCRLPVLLFCALVLHGTIAAANPGEFSFGIIAPFLNAVPDESLLQNSIVESDTDNLAFVVTNGIKARNETCSDKVYNRRKVLFDKAKNGLIVSLTANDWSECKNKNGKSAAIERLNRLRDLFFTNEFSFGATKIPLIRQSITPKFRSYGENARWEIENILFTTINLPANNNHYLVEAGRNSEFEDRTIANRVWLQRIFASAYHKKMQGIVLFCDGNPLLLPNTGQFFTQNRKQDGFAEVRKQIASLSMKFPGKVLVIHSQTTTDTTLPNNIAWQNKLGDLAVASGWIQVVVDTSRPSLFTVVNNAGDLTSSPP